MDKLPKVLINFSNTFLEQNLLKKCLNIRETFLRSLGLDPYIRPEAPSAPGEDEMDSGSYSSAYPTIPMTSERNSLTGRTITPIKLCVYHK